MYLLSQPTVSALIGDRLYPARLPQGVTLPAVTYQWIARVASVTYEGAADLARGRIQIDCWATSYAAMVSLAKAIRAALSGYRGAMGATPITNARVVNEVDLPDPEPALWRRMVEVVLWHRED